MSIKKTREAKKLLDDVRFGLRRGGSTGFEGSPEMGGRGTTETYGFDQSGPAPGYGDSDDDLKALSYAVKPTPKKTLGQRIVDSIRGISKFSPTGAVTRGLGNLFDRLANLRGFNPDGTRRTQAQFERARDIRRAEKSIANIMGRDAPFTALTLDRLADLYSVLGQDLPSSIDESLIGTTNVTRSGTADDVFPDRVEGIVTQAPQTFREAMAQLNLERGVPKDQVFLSAKDLIDLNKTISSEDLGTIQSRIATSAGVPESAIQLTKTFNTPQELENLGVLEDTLFGGKKLTDQGKVLEDFRRQATKMRDAEMSPTYQQGVGSQLNRMLNNPGLYGDIIENKDFIQSAINKGFLSDRSDFENQKPFEDIL